MSGGTNIGERNLLMIDIVRIICPNVLRRGFSC
jgi:hypothetical protein